MAKARPMQVAANVLMKLSVVLLWAGVLGIIGNLSMGKPVALGILAVVLGTGLNLVAAVLLRDYVLPLETFLVALCFPSLIFGIGAVFRAVAGRPRSSLFIATALVTFGALGLYVARNLSKKRTYGRPGPSNQRLERP